METIILYFAPEGSNLAFQASREGPFFLAGFATGAAGFFSGSAGFSDSPHEKKIPIKKTDAINTDKIPRFVLKILIIPSSFLLNGYGRNSKLHRYI
ncbi:MAG: hypothetical protein IMF02_09425 [Proteobacteria bacterium]|nr:hypothetical protein [Pseudomonadota bacterium]